MRQILLLLRRISWPHARKHALRTLFTLVGVATGVSALVATNTVTKSAFQTFDNAVRSTAGPADLFIGNKGSALPEELVDAVAALPEVRRAVPLIQAYVETVDENAPQLVVFGFDILGERGWEQQLPPASLTIPDELEFVANPDSIVLARGFAAAQAIGLGDSIEVFGGNGRATLRVRGLVEDIGPIELYGGAVGLMDLPAAQLLLARDRKVDRIDIILADHADKAAAREQIVAVVNGRGHVRDITMLGRRAEDALRTMRMMTARPGFMAVLVGFFLIYYSVSVSIAQRRRSVDVLDSLGVTPGAVVAWLAIEGVVLGLVGAAAGLGAGIALSTLALQLFDDVVVQWVRIPPPNVMVEPSEMLLACAAGVSASVIACLVAGYGLVSRSFNRPIVTCQTSKCSGWSALIASATIFVVTGVLIGVVPRGMSDGAIIAYANAVQVLPMLGLALLSPAAFRFLGGLLRRFTHATGRPHAIVAGSFLERDSRRALVVVFAVVLSLGWTIGETIYTHSIRSGWVGWLYEHGRYDAVVLSRDSQPFDLLTARTFPDVVVEQLRRADGIVAVQAMRFVEARFRDRTIVIEALDPSPKEPPLTTGSWLEVRDALEAGEGVLVSENLAQWADLSVGAAVELESPTGRVGLPVLGSVVDAYAGDMGSVLMARGKYRALWQDDQLSFVRLWLEDAADLPTVRAALSDGILISYGLQFLDFDASVNQLRRAFDAAFAGTYALLFVAFAVAFVGIVNFLVTTTLDRAPWYAVLRGLGFDRRHLVAITVLESSILGAVGTVYGACAGVFGGLLMIKFSIPLVCGWVFDVALPATALSVALAGTILLSVMAGLFPGLRVARARDVRGAVQEQV